MEPLNQLKQRVGEALLGKTPDQAQPIDELAQKLVNQASTTGPNQIAAADLVLRILAAK